MKTQQTSAKCKNCKHCVPVFHPMLSDKCDLTGKHISRDGGCDNFKARQIK